MRREERVTVQGPVKEHQPDGMSHRGFASKSVQAASAPPPRALDPSLGSGPQQLWHRDTATYTVSVSGCGSVRGCGFKMELLRRVVSGLRPNAVAGLAAGNVPAAAMTHRLLAGVPPPPSALTVVTEPAAPRRARSNNDARLPMELLGATPAPPHRTQAAQEALVARLRRETNSHSGLEPPADATDWPVTVLRRWFEDGGTVTVDALSREPPTSRCPLRLIDEVGSGFPVAELPPLDLGHGGVLGALRRSDDATLAALAARLAEDKWVACALGADAGALAGFAAEAARARAFMRPGEVRASDGSGTVSGRSPSGAKRGDSYVLSRTLPGAPAAWPALASADAALGAVGSALAPHLRAHPALRLELATRSDTFVACFAGDGLGYGAHFDGDQHCRITAILYTAEWQPGHGGRLQLLDEPRRCWWAVPPRADTLVLFLSDRVLHKVEPCHAPRYALTVFMSAVDRELEHACLRSVLASYS